MKNRVFTKDEILNAKGYEKNGANYGSPAQLLKGLIFEDEFLQEFGSNPKIILQGTHEIININDDKSENISFGRYHVNYNFHIDEDLRYDLGLIVSLDKARPISKIYSGIKVRACMNLCIFGAEQLKKFEGNNWNDYKIYFKDELFRIQQNIEASKIIIENLKNIFLTHAKIQQLNGYILEEIMINNDIAGIQPVINAIKLQGEKSNKYFAENGLSAWLYFNSLTEYLDEKVHPLDIPEKTFNLFNAIKHLLVDEAIKVLENKQVDLIESIQEIESDDLLKAVEEIESDDLLKAIEEIQKSIDAEIIQNEEPSKNPKRRKGQK